MKVLDFSSRSNRYFGHDFNLCHKLDKEGYRWELAVWYPERPEKEDFILLGLKENDVRPAVISEIRSCGNPSDMYFIKINIKGASKKYLKYQRKREE